MTRGRPRAIQPAEQHERLTNDHQYQGLMSHFENLRRFDPQNSLNLPLPEIMRLILTDYPYQCWICVIARQRPSDFIRHCRTNDHQRLLRELGFDVPELRVPYFTIMSCPGMSSAVAHRILNHRTTGAVVNFLDRYLCTSPWTQRDQLQQLATELRAIHDNDPPAEQVRRILARVPARFDENVQVTHLLAELNQVFYPGGAGDVEFDSDDSDDDDEADDDEADLLSETLLPEAVYDTADGLVAAKRAPVFGAIPPTAHVNNSMQPITVPNTTPWVAPQSVATHVSYLTPVVHPPPHYATARASNQNPAPMIAFTSPLPQPLPPMHMPQQSNKRARVETEQSLSASPVASPFPPAPVIQSQTIPSYPSAVQQQLTSVPQPPQLSSLAVNDSPNTGPRTSNPDSIAQAPAVLSETLTPEPAVAPVQPALSFLDTLHSIDDEITMLLDSPAADNSQLVLVPRQVLHLLRRLIDALISNASNRAPAHPIEALINRKMPTPVGGQKYHIGNLPLAVFWCPNFSEQRVHSMSNSIPQYDAILESFQSPMNSVCELAVSELLDKANKDGFNNLNKLFGQSIFNGNIAYVAAVLPLLSHIFCFRNLTALSNKMMASLNRIGIHDNTARLATATSLVSGLKEVTQNREKEMKAAYSTFYGNWPSSIRSAVRGLLTKSPEMVENVVEALESLNRIAEIAYFTATCDNSSTKTNSSDYHYRGFHARSAATFAALTIVGFDSSRVIYPARAMMRAIQYQYSLHHRFAPRAGPDAVSEDGRFVMGFVQYLRNLLSADPSNVEIVKYLSDIIEKKDVRTGDYLLTLSVFASSSLNVTSRLNANPSQFFAHYTTNMRLWSEASTGDKLYVTELNHSKPPQV